jgi:hypothetical protein
MEVPAEVLANLTSFSDDPTALEEWRLRIAAAIELMGEAPIAVLKTDDAPRPIGNLAGLWRSQTMYQDWMEPPHDLGWLRPRSHWPVVPQWQWPAGFNKTDLFTDEMCTDGLLGGWNGGTPGNRPKTNPPDPTQDVAYRAVDGSLAYRWNLLDLRLDDMVGNGLRPLVMLGRVPWSLSAGWPASASQCSYGNAAPPTNFTEWGGLRVGGAFIQMPLVIFHCRYISLVFIRTKYNEGRLNDTVPPVARRAGGCAVRAHPGALRLGGEDLALSGLDRAKPARFFRRLGPRLRENVRLRGRRHSARAGWVGAHWPRELLPLLLGRAQHLRLAGPDLHPEHPRVVILERCQGLDGTLCARRELGHG